MTTASASALARVCFICGAGHSGSTLLGLILGSHPQVFYAGEVSKTRFLHDSSKPERKRVCGICGPGCTFWGGFAPAAGAALYAQLAARSGRPILLDSTKRLSWIEAQLADLAALQIPTALIFLQRDGRAVVNSRLRKYPQLSPTRIIEEWAAQISASSSLFTRFDGPKLALRYEDMATEPARSITAACALLGIAYRPALLAYHEHEHHTLGGNQGTRSLVQRKQPPEPGAEIFYQQPAIRLDTRWRQELAPAVEQLFEQLAGSINIPFRWDDVSSSDEEHK